MFVEVSTPHSDSELSCPSQPADLRAPVADRQFFSCGSGKEKSHLTGILFAYDSLPRKTTALFCASRQASMTGYVLAPCAQQALLGHLLWCHFADLTQVLQYIVETRFKPTNEMNCHHVVMLRRLNLQQIFGCHASGP